MAAADHGPIRRAFDKAERTIGEPLERAVTTPAGTDFLINALRVRMLAGQLIEATTRTALHLANLPTRSDIASLGRQIASLENDVRRLTEPQRTGDGTSKRARSVSEG